MKKLIYIAILVICTYTGYHIGENTWVHPLNSPTYHFNTEEARQAEIKYSNAVLEGLHYFYQRDPKFWVDSFALTEEYKHIEQANHGDWEDFYCEW